MAHTDPRAERALVVLQTLRLALAAGLRSAQFAPPEGQAGFALVTPHVGGYLVTIGDPFDGNFGWYPRMEDAAMAVALHRQTPKRVRFRY